MGLAFFMTIHFPLDSLPLLYRLFEKFLACVCVCLLALLMSIVLRPSVSCPRYLQLRRVGNCCTLLMASAPVAFCAQGIAIGAALALYELSNDTALLAKAATVAQFLFESQTIAVPGVTSGPVMYDGPTCTDVDCPQFKGIAYRYASRARCCCIVDSTRSGCKGQQVSDAPPACSCSRNALRRDPNTHKSTASPPLRVRRYYAQLCTLRAAMAVDAGFAGASALEPVNCSVLDGSASAIWSFARDANSTLFAANWAGPPPHFVTSVNLAQDSSASMALAVYASYLGGRSSAA